MNNLKTFEEFDWTFGFGKKKPNVSELFDIIKNEFYHNLKKNGKILKKFKNSYKYKMMNGDVLDVSNNDIYLNGKSMKKTYPDETLKRIQNQQIERIYHYLDDQYKGVYV